MIGQTLSHFEITARLGEGGMGEVWKAADTRLGREVAIKVLPQAFSADPERLARFEREAQVLASLNHPNIAGIYEFREAEVDGERHHLLVMELATGEDLSQRLARGAVPLDEALPIALQIAEGLEAAHERGIVHRDLKPANVMLAKDGALNGQLKILDFGLAKALEAHAGGSDSAALSLSPTLTAGMTQAGVLLGTAAYMSPEQAKGLEADRRADVWAFGVVLWEMLSGKRLFSGDSISDTLAAVLRDEIDASELPADTPAPLLSLLSRCLDRDPRSRLRDIGEARVALAALSGDGSVSTIMGAPGVSTAEPAVEPTSSRLPWLVAAVMTGVALLLGLLGLSSEDPPVQLVRSSILGPEGAQLDAGSGLALSPDGSKLIYAAIDENGSRALWIHSFETGEAMRVKGSESALYPFWSPDGQNVAFVARSQLMRAPATGGPVQNIAAGQDWRGGTWSDDGTIVFAPDFRGGLNRVSASGGEAVPITEIDREAGEQSHRYPLFLPDGKRLLVLVQTAEGGSQTDNSRIEVLDLASGERREVVRANSSFALSPSGHLLFLRDGTLVAAPFDVKSATVTGEARPVESGIGYTGNEFATFSVASNGFMVYQSGSLYEAFTRIGVIGPAGDPIGNFAPPDFHQDVEPVERRDAGGVPRRRQHYPLDLRPRARHQDTVHLSGWRSLQSGLLP